MAFLGEELGCFHDGQVAINTNACQQEDAAVKGGFLQAWNQFAHKCAEHPVTGVKVSSPEWESQGKEQVGDGQVHQSVDVLWFSMQLTTKITTMLPGKLRQKTMT